MEGRERAATIVMRKRGQRAKKRSHRLVERKGQNRTRETKAQERREVGQKAEAPAKTERNRNREAEMAERCQKRGAGVEARKRR